MFPGQISDTEQQITGAECDRVSSLDFGRSLYSVSVPFVEPLEVESCGDSFCHRSSYGKSHGVLTWPPEYGLQPLRRER